MSVADVPFGARFGRLVVLADGGMRRSYRHWICGCDCGRIKAISAGNIVRGQSKSCGCRARMSHGLSKIPEYSVWEGMIQRCCNPNNVAYARYGGREITICKEWRTDFAAFYAYVGPRPSPAYSIDRIDNDQGYVPGNVRWVTASDQQRNRRVNTLITYGEETRCVTEWAELYGLKVGTLRRRLQSGWAISNALTTSVQRRV